MSGWSGSTRRDRLPPDWQRIRRRILARDAHQCQHLDTGTRCCAPANQVDHINRGDVHEDWNLQALCEHHHRVKSAREGHAARFQPERRTTSRQW